MFKDEVRRFYWEHRKEGVRPAQALISAKHDARYDPKTKYGRKLDILESRYDAYEGEQITKLPNGWKIKVRFEYDTDSGPPEKDCDGFGSTYRKGGYNSPDEQERKWVLYSGHYEWLIYDWKAAYDEALRDEWNTPPYNFSSKQEQALAAVKSTFDVLYGYYNDNWWYVGMIVTLLDENDEELDEESCWGFESNAISYLCSEARTWAARMILDARCKYRESTDAWRQLEFAL